MAIVCPMQPCTPREWLTADALRGHLEQWHHLGRAAVNAAVHEAVVLDGVPCCASCRSPHPRRHSPGRYPRLCDECKAAT